MFDSEDLQKLFYLANEMKEDASFKNQINNLIERHKRLKEEKANANAYALKLIESAKSAKSIRDLDPYVAALLEAVEKKYLHYGGCDWVPSEYASLGRHGLVRCDQSSVNLYNTLPSRTIYPTEFGSDIAQRVREAMQCAA